MPQFVNAYPCSDRHSGSGITAQDYQNLDDVIPGDGSCFLVSEDLSCPLELSGPDCDPVYRAATDGTFIYTVCRDGAIRKYRTSQHPAACTVARMS